MEQRKRIVVFGATGRTGEHVLTQSLEEGYDVIAYVRNPTKLSLQHARLTIMQGDIFNEEQVHHAIEGSDAVLCALGVPMGSKLPVCSVGTQNIIQAMKRNGVNRLIVITGLGVKRTRGDINWFERAFLTLFLCLDQAAADDKEIQEDLIEESQLDWTILRPPWLTHGKKTSRYRVGMGESVHPTLISRISRRDLAECMVQQITDRTFIRQAPYVMY
ncbi:NAD(P)-dependent oxidoreductase [Marininema halotolerans]|uniref:Putative NADH-flavin reductase n=1 Tax=Marininema halotolerans TaxID=1155944 RepID=A0A1I6PAU9_9BACL|nr:SDR family oxidoreductase [Marininema halotolerans]SFS37306.1 Putative NADH-flavin reductase [Marininema halotolerans]